MSATISEWIIHAFCETGRTLSSTTKTRSVALVHARPEGDNVHDVAVDVNIPGDLPSTACFHLDLCMRSSIESIPAHIRSAVVGVGTATSRAVTPTAEAMVVAGGPMCSSL
jgi:hypothetical protein